MSPNEQMIAAYSGILQKKLSGSAHAISRTCEKDVSVYIEEMPQLYAVLFISSLLLYYTDRISDDIPPQM